MFPYFSLMFLELPARLLIEVFIKRISYEKTNKIKKNYDKNSEQFFHLLFPIESCKRHGSELREKNFKNVFPSLFL